LPNDNNAEKETKVAVIDVGFNSLKMVKYRAEASGSTKSYGQLGVLARLGEGLERSGYLGEEPMSRTIRAIKLCQEVASLESIKHLLLIGTSPVREAANREEFLSRVREETGLEMRLLTGNEEAIYGFLGAEKSARVPTAIFFDLGGGSLELTYAENFHLRRILSLPLGALRLTSVFANGGGTFSRKARARMSKLISRSLPSRRDLDLKEDATLIGTGGTVRAMARFEQELTGYPFNKINNYSLEFDSVQQMSKEFFRLKPDELAKFDSLGQDRAETMAAGAMVVRLLMKKLGLGRLSVSTHGLRDGILAEFLEREKYPPKGAIRIEDVRLLLSRPTAPLTIGGNTDLVGRLVRNGVFNEREGALLMTAVELGRSRDCRDADPGALFGTVMSEDLPMNHADQLLMAISLVRARRPRAASWLLKKYGPLLPDGNPNPVKRLGSCLRLMEVLDRSSAKVRVAYSRGLRLSVLGSKTPFPNELATMAASSLSASIRRPVTISMKTEGKNHRAKLLEAVV